MIHVFFANRLSQRKKKKEAKENGAKEGKTKQTPVEKCKRKWYLQPAAYHTHLKAYWKISK